MTTGCGDACPIFRREGSEYWRHDNPQARRADAVRPICDEIKTWAEKLLADLIPAT